MTVSPTAGGELAWVCVFLLHQLFPAQPLRLELILFDFFAAFLQHFLETGRIRVLRLLALGLLLHPFVVLADCLVFWCELRSC